MTDSPKKGPGFEFFNNIQNGVEIELEKPQDPPEPKIVSSWDVETDDAVSVSWSAPKRSYREVVKSVSWEPFVDEDEDYRRLSDEELKMVVFEAPTITLSSECGGGFIEHHAPNGKFFTVRDMLQVICSHELQARSASLEVDDYHHIFGGIYFKGEGRISRSYWEDGVGYIVWDS